MRARSIERPVPWRQAFGQRGDAAVLSQAASLLLLGAELRGDAAALLARARAVGAGRRVDALPRRDVAALGVPRVRFTGRRVPAGEIRASLRRRYGRRAPSRPEARGRRRVSPDLLADLARRLSRSPTPLAAAELLESCLAHPDELPRVAAAASYLALGTEPRPALDTLAAGTRSRDPLVREVAAAALARVAPEHPGLQRLTTRRRHRGRGRRSRTSLLVHGTFARQSAWWQPGGDFHEYLRAEVRPDLYGAADRFDWSGGWSDGARALGGTDLVAWVADRGLAGLDLFTHSHGGSVAMVASQDGLVAGTLVLLSCPVHVDKYLPDFSRVSRVISIRVRLDLVILIDGGGQRFRHPQIEEHVLPIWFDHGATHDPAVWRDHDVPSLL